jgi:hypothetical protein
VLVGDFPFVVEARACLVGYFEGLEGVVVSACGREVEEALVLEADLRCDAGTDKGYFELVPG